MIEDTDFKDLLVQWAQHGKIANMHMERQLALIKAAVKSKAFTTNTLHPLCSLAISSCMASVLGCHARRGSGRMMAVCCSLLAGT